MMTIILRILCIALLMIFWFFISGMLWGRVFPLEKVYWLAGKIGIVGDESIYDLAAFLVLSVSGLSSVVLTYLSWKLFGRKK